MESYLALPVWNHDEPDSVEPVPVCNSTMGDVFKSKFKEGEFDIESFVASKVCEFGDYHKQKECSESEEPQPKKAYFH